MPEKVIHEIRLNQYSPQYAGGNRLRLGTSHSYGIERLHLILDEGWDGLAVTATFHSPAGLPVRMLMDTDGMVDVPPEATASAGLGKIVISGVADDVQRISCNLTYTVMEHAHTFGGTSTGPTPDVISQILASTLEDRKAAATSSAQAEDAASIAAASARAAAESEAGSKSHADNAASSASAAYASASTASTKAGEALASASQAGAKASEAAQSASTAATRAAYAENSANLAAEKSLAAESSARAAAESAVEAAKSLSASEESAAAAAKFAEQATQDEAKLSSAVSAAEASAKAAASSEDAAISAANNAMQAATSNGYMQMGIDPETGHLMYARTTNLKDRIDFEIVNDTNLEVRISV